MLHNSKLLFKDLNKLPSRQNLLDPNEYKINMDKLINKKNIIFLPNTIYERSMENIKYKPYSYKLILCGILKCGFKTTVILNGFYPYFDLIIKNKENKNLNQIKNEIQNKVYNLLIDVCKKNNIQNVKSELHSINILTAKPFKWFQENSHYLFRLYFLKLKYRKLVLEFFRNLEYETANDDLTAYYRLIGRNYNINFSSWNVISNYEIYNLKYNGHNYPDNTMINTLVIQTHYNDYNLYDDKNLINNISLLKDKSLCLSWDIETYSPNYILPMPFNKDHKLFMIGITIHWIYDKNPLLRICIVDVNCHINKDYLLIQCNNEKEVLFSFIQILHNFKPEFLIAFNNALYDNIWIINRGLDYSDFIQKLIKNTSIINLDSDINIKTLLQWNFVTEKIKIESDRFMSGNFFKIPGLIDIDVRVIFMKIFPTAEKSSLNYYLKQNNLASKDDLPIKNLFDWYKEALIFKSNNIIHEKSSLNISKIGHYCCFDSQRTIELLIIRNIIYDYRNIANLSLVSLYDCLYRANSCKIRNIIMAETNRRNYYISNITKYNDTFVGKYEGAMVIDPHKGLKVSKLSIRERWLLGKEQKKNKIKNNN